MLSEELGSVETLQRRLQLHPGPHPQVERRALRDKEDAEKAAAPAAVEDAVHPGPPATHSIWAVWKAGEMVYQTGELPKTLQNSIIHAVDENALKRH